jgi:hypothetical protein
MTDVTDNILALAWEDLSMCEEYPEYRLILHFGEHIDTIQNKISNKMSCYGKENQRENS